MLLSWASIKTNLLCKGCNTMKKVSKILIVLCSLVALSACTEKNFSEQGTPLSQQKVNKIIEGSTTEIQLLSLFGEPTSKIALKNNETQYTYLYSKKSSTSHPIIGETQYDILEGKLDVITSNGMVIWFNYNENIKQKKW